MTEAYMMFKNESRRKPFATDELVFMDESKVHLQRELGLYLGGVESHYAENPKRVLDILDRYYLQARDGLMGSPVNDTWSLLYFRTLVEMLVNFIQTFRVMHDQPPSKVINEDLKDNWVKILG